MRAFSEFSIKRPVATTMIIITMVFAGLVSIFSIPTALLPDFDIPVVLVRTNWVGASPEDVDKMVTKEIEDAVIKVEGVDKISSFSNQDYSMVVVEFDYGADNDVKQREVQTELELDKILNQLPDEVDPPVVSKVDINARPVITYSMTGTDLTELYNVADVIIKPQLEKIDGIGEIDISGGLEEHILIAIDPEKLQSFGLDISRIKDLVRLSNINIPTGTVSYGDKEYNIRINGELESVEEVKNVIIRNNDGDVLRLRDVADVSFATKDIESYARRNGKAALQLSATKAKGGNSVEIVTRVKEEIAKLDAQIPDNVSMDIEYDSSIDINNSINNVANNAVTGLILASIVLFIFLKNWRATSIVAIAIPVSVIFTFFFLSIKGINLNIISLMGLALGVGMLVDNSIVVLDNIFRHMTELKKPKFQAARDGASEMAIPILASTATTVAVFLPIVFQAGMAKEIFHDLSYTITFALAASLLVALTFVPMSASKFLNERMRIDKEGAIISRLKKFYKVLMKKALRWYGVIITIVITIALFFGSIALFKQFGKTSFFPDQDESRYTITAKPAKGLNIEKVNGIALQMEDMVKDDKYTENYSVSLDKNGIALQVEVPKKDKRPNNETMKRIADHIRPKLKDIKDVDIEVKETVEGGPPQNSVGTIEIKLFGDDYSELIKISEDFKEEFRKIPNFVDVGSTYTGGLPQARIDIDRVKAQYYGLRVTSIATYIAYQIRGEDTISIKTGNKEIDVTVRLKENRRKNLEDILNLDIPTDTGSIKLKEVASIRSVEGPAQIQKQDKQKVISVGFNLFEIDMGRAVEKIEEVATKYEFPAGVTYDIGGEFEDRKEVFGQLFIALGIGIFLIYFILAVQFESFITPFILMGSVPLAVIGVLIGMVITNTPFDVMVMVGIIMLAGIVVNNAIVLIDYINLLRARGEPLKDAVIDAGRTRLRPILMTTLTTIFGMIPLSLGIGEGSEFYRGMAVAVIFGLAMSTLLTLVFIPVIYYMVEKTKQFIAKLFHYNLGKKKDLADDIVDEIIKEDI